MLLIWSGTTKYCIELCGGPLFEILQFLVIQCWYCYYTAKYIIPDIYDQLSKYIVQNLGRSGEQTIDAFVEMYYLANHGSLERSVNLVLQGFIHRHMHFRMRIVVSLYLNSFVYIGEKRWKLYVHPNWKQLSTLDSKPFCLGRLPPWYDKWYLNTGSIYKKS